MKATKTKKWNKSISWWASVAAVAALIVALGAWLLPDPLRTEAGPTPQLTTIAQSLGITEIIPPRKPGTIRILVARFDEANQSNYRVTEVVLTKLRSSMSRYPDTEVMSTDRVITEQEGSETAIKIGEVYNANIVIWGWYGLTPQAVPLGIHFETVPNSEISDPSIPGMCTAVSASQLRNVDPSELSNLTLQTDLSNELSYVTIFTMGWARYGAEDWIGSINLFNDAIKYLDRNTILSAKTSGNNVLIDTDLLYFYRARAYLESDNVEAALDDMIKIGGPIVDDPVFQYNFGRVFEKNKDYQKAVNHFTLALDKQPPRELSAILFYVRGRAFNSLAMFENAKMDFEAAFEIDSRSITEYILENISLNDRLSFANRFVDEDPTNFAAYYVRGLINEELGNANNALKDYSKAIEIYPDFHIARKARWDLIDNDDKLYDSNLLIHDIEILLPIEEYQTPCNFLSAALVYQKSEDQENAHNYFKETINAATLEINSSPDNIAALILRATSQVSYGLEESFLVSFRYDLAAIRDLRAAKRIDTSEKYQEIIDDNLKFLYGYYAKLSAFVIFEMVLVGILIRLTIKNFKGKRTQRRKRHHVNRP